MPAFSLVIRRLSSFRRQLGVRNPRRHQVCCEAPECTYMARLDTLCHYAERGVVFKCRARGETGFGAVY